MRTSRGCEEHSDHSCRLTPGQHERTVPASTKDQGSFSHRTLHWRATRPSCPLSAGQAQPALYAVCRHRRRGATGAVRSGDRHLGLSQLRLALWGVPNAVQDLTSSALYLAPYQAPSGRAIARRRGGSSVTPLLPTAGKWK